MKKYFSFRFFFASKYASLLSKKPIQSIRACVWRPGQLFGVPSAKNGKNLQISCFRVSKTKQKVGFRFGVSAQPANYFCSEEGCFNFGLNAFWCCANSSERSGQLFFYSLKNLRNCKFCCSKTFPISLMMSSHAEMPIFWCSAEV